MKRTSQKESYQSTSDHKDIFALLCFKKLTGQPFISPRKQGEEHLHPQSHSEEVSCHRSSCSTGTGTLEVCTGDRPSRASEFAVSNSSWTREGAAKRSLAGRGSQNPRAKMSGAREGAQLHPPHTDCKPGEPSDLVSWLEVGRCYQRAVLHSKTGPGWKELLFASLRPHLNN